MTNDSILKLAGAFQGLNTSRIRFWAFSYSIGEPCGRSFQLIMYFILVLPPELQMVPSARRVAANPPFNPTISTQEKFNSSVWRATVRFESSAIDYPWER